MISRREAITGAIVAGTFLSSPVEACKAPAPKDRKAYSRAIDRVLAAWWARDFNGFLEPFRHPEREEPLPDRTLFNAHYTDRAVRFRGGLLFSGASVIVQVITPHQPDFKEGLCGGHATSDLFLAKFYPGLHEPVVESVQFLQTDVLAYSEWKHLPGAPDVKIKPYWKLVIQP